MSSQKERNSDTIAGVAVDDLLDTILRQKGLTIPTTPDEVALAEAEIDEENVHLPESLQNPLAFLHKERQSNLLHFSQPQQGNDEFREELARVARDGGEISEEIADRMRRDRLEAERNVRNGNRGNDATT